MSPKTRRSTSSFATAATTSLADALSARGSLPPALLGLALKELGLRSSGEPSAELLGEALAAFRGALEVYTRAHLPGRCVLCRANEGIVLEALKRPAEAVMALLGAAS